jgi:DMSO/TMAO reductase YedYZ molybdopterin-dependent catalytic subunit
VFLSLVGLGLAGVVAGGRFQGWVGSAVAPLVSQGGGGIGALIPGANRFRIYTVTGALPAIDASSYHLEVVGLVERPLSLSLEQLRAMRATHLVRDFQCVTGWRVPSVHWVGVRLAHLLDAAGVRPGAKALNFVSLDGMYTESLTLAQAALPDVIVAYDMLGAPLSDAHGGPVRLYVAPMYGYKSCKWLGRVEVVDRVEPGYWEQNGYAVDAWVGHSNGLSDAPIT